MASRDKNDLHGPLRIRWEWLEDWWNEENPENPVFLTCTYRPPEEQDALVREGRSRAKAWQSLHNYKPAYAFDIAFRDGNDITWEWDLFEDFGDKAKELGLEWGGDWPGLRDGPHIQMPMTWADAKANSIPLLPPLPLDNQVTEVWFVPQEGHPGVRIFSDIKRINIVGRKLFILAKDS